MKISVAMNFVKLRGLVIIGISIIALTLLVLFSNSLQGKLLLTSLTAVRHLISGGAIYLQTQDVIIDGKNAEIEIYCDLAGQTLLLISHSHASGSLYIADDGNRGFLILPKNNLSLVIDPNQSDFQTGDKEIDTIPLKKPELPKLELMHVLYLPLLKKHFHSTEDGTISGSFGQVTASLMFCGSNVKSVQLSNLGSSNLPINIFVDYVPSKVISHKVREISALKKDTSEVRISPALFLKTIEGLIYSVFPL